MKTVKKALIIAVLTFQLPISSANALTNPKHDSMEETVVYDRERIIASIDKQLININREQVKTKEPLILNASIEDIQSLIQSKQLSYEELVSIYLLRIQEIDQSGVTLNTITEINPHILEEARQCDIERKQTTSRPLYGIPILLKDNIQTALTMPTSAGTYALKDWIADKDAEVIENLKVQGALVLGKANMSEWAGYISSESPPGYSSKKGDTFNPYNPRIFSTRGSSSGSAAAVAADLTMLSLGTETFGSIISPAAYQSIVGLRPSTGLVSNNGIIPLSQTIDTIGPMARNVKDAALLLSSMIPDQNNQPVDYTEGLSKDGLEGKRIGFLFSSADQPKERKAVIEKIKVDLQTAGATLIENLSVSSPDIPTCLSFLAYDFKHSLQNYIEKQKHFPFQSLKEIITFNEENPQRYVKYGQNWLIDAEESVVTKLEFETKLQVTQEAARNELNKYLKEQQIDALVMINEEECLISSIAGYPELSVPAGYDEENHPIGLTFIGDRFGEKELFKMAYAYEQHSQKRISPYFS
ncbi:amidase family protein [Bacillus thuringiensis]|uniref:amidase family protein n=1 Tax=Bacillus thuringiensis TaxID=1428 RepID=UPI000BEE6B6F|nr:amidase family protein [Bacillus thuringiensis]EKS8367402.1 amidase [Bacillus cereus]EKS8373609.1 amidase [Bacillus cereus]MED3391928.1 amidase family protein [Bacillus thuringiensis]PDY32120.1 amidase [Bacillus thuringiensis]PFE33224.1 amidase [Bacillus thuringiensis]